MEEASYEGNGRVLEEMFRQLKLDTIKAKKEFATKRLLPYSGDQLTVDCLRRLRGFRFEDLNGYDRLDFPAPTFG